MAIPTIRTEALTKRYPNGIFGTRDLSVALEGGDLVGLIGPNGAGKSTLINLLCGLKSPTSGSVEVRTAGGRFSWCPQRALLDWSLTPYENILFGAAMAGLRGRAGAASARRALEVMELAKVAGQDVATLTGGQLRRVQIARALAMQPSIAILDEPASGLDPHGTVLLFEHLAELARAGTLVVVSSHDLQTIQEYARRLLLLSAGTLKHDGTVQRYLQAREAERGLRFSVEVASAPEKILQTVVPLAAEHAVKDGTIRGRLNPGITASRFLSGIQDIEGIVSVDLGRSDLREAYLDDAAGKR